MNARRLMGMVLAMAVIVGAHGSLAGCGQKGPLYLPADTHTAEPEKEKDSN